MLARTNMASVAPVISRPQVWRLKAATAAQVSSGSQISRSWTEMGLVCKPDGIDIARGPLLTTAGTIPFSHAQTALAPGAR